MVTSGVSNFDPTFEDILQDAAAMVGGGPLLADELISARRGLDYLLTDLQNRNVLLHKIETTVVPVSASVSALTFGPSISDVLTATVRTSTTEMVMDRDGYERWAEIPTKSVTGRPIRYWWDRRRNSNVMNLWPLPDQTYDIVLTVQKNTEDTLRAFDNIDVPRRFLPAITYGLAHWIGMRRGSRADANRLTAIKVEYERMVRDAMREDRERGPFLLRIGRR
jgi:hypothetical protein